MIKKIISILLITFLIIQTYSFLYNKPVLFTFTLTDSMEPTIMTGDFFFLIPTFMSKVEVGDIIVFEDPRQIYSNSICHRVIQVSEGGFITRGDNSPFSDQQSGMPPIEQNSIHGKVATISNNPVIIPRLGLVILQMQKTLDSYKIPFVILLLITGVSLVLLDQRYEVKKRNHWRIRVKERHLLLFAMAFIILLSSTLMLMKCKIVDVKYLAASGFTVGNAIKIGETSERELTVENTGIFPIYVYLQPQSQGLSHESSKLEYLWFKEASTFILTLKPIGYIGWRTEKTGVYIYPAILPEGFTLQLVEINPYLPIALVIGLISLFLLMIYKKYDGGERYFQFKIDKIYNKIRRGLM